MMGPPTLSQRAIAFLGLTTISACVAALFVVVATGLDSPLPRLIKALPDQLEIALAPGDLTAAGRLDAAFADMGYRLEAIAAGREVPPVFLASVPTDLADLREIDTKKRVFLRVMLPLILAVNDEIAADRARLDEIADRMRRNKFVNAADTQWVADLAARYGTTGQPVQALLTRVDTIPPSLALAQAIEESGWGTSRFVREANNLYGQITTSAAALTAEGDSARRLAIFESLRDSVRAYAHNLNTHRAYDALRRSRAAARARNSAPDGHSLAGTLSAYSERGHDYIDALRALIRNNTLTRYDHARLAKPRTRQQMARLFDAQAK